MTDFDELESMARRLKSSPADREPDLEALAGAVRPVVLRFVRRLVRSHDAEDVGQDALIRIVEGFDTWSPERGAFMPWMSAVVRNAATDHLRRSGARDVHRGPEFETEGVEQDSADDETSRYLASIDDRSLVRSVHEALRRRRDVNGRRVLAAARDLAVAGENLTIVAISSEAEISESTTRRALRRVRSIVNELEER